MAYASKRFSITVSTLALILALPGVSVAQDNERIDLLRDEYENASSHTIDISIPAAPGLVLAGVTADSQVGHNLGSDLSYDFATTQSGGLAGALTLRPYWTFMRPPPTGEAPEQVGDFIHILRRTQVSAAFGQREIGGDDRAVAGLGVVFYPYTGNDPRTDTRFRTCMTTAVDALAAGSAFVNAVYPAENQNLSAQQINELLVQRDVIEPDFSAVNPGSNFGDELREHLRRSDQGQLVTDAVIDPIVNDFNNQIERRARSQSLTNAQINEVLEAAGLVETDFEQTSRLTLNPQSIEIIAGLIETYLKEAGLAGDAASAAIANGYRGRVRQILARPGEPSQGVLQATFINRFLEFQGVEDPKFEIDDVAPAAEEQMVAFMRARGASDSAIASAREGYYNRRIAVARAAIDEAWIQRFLASWGIPGASDFHFVRNSVETEVNQFLFAKHPDLRISTGPDASRPMTREDVVDITLSVGAANLEGFSDRLTDSSAFGQFNTAIGNCRSDAAKYYLQGSEFTVGIGSAWTSADDSYERLAPDGISAWLRYRYPLPVTREETLSNGDKIEVPVGYLNLFYRRIVDEEVELSQSSKDTAQTNIFALALDRPTEDTVFRLGASYVDREFDTVGVADQDFWRFNVGYERRLSDTIWLTAEYGNVDDSSIYSEGEFVRVGFRFESDD